MMRVQPPASGQGHDGAVEMLVGAAEPLLVIGGRGALALLHGGPHGGHRSGLPPPRMALTSMARRTV